MASWWLDLQHAYRSPKLWARRNRPMWPYLRIGDSSFKSGQTFCMSSPRTAAEIITQPTSLNANYGNCFQIGTSMNNDEGGQRWRIIGALQLDCEHHLWSPAKYHGMRPMPSVIPYILRHEESISQLPFSTIREWRHTCMKEPKLRFYDTKSIKTGRNCRLRNKSYAEPTKPKSQKPSSLSRAKINASHIAQDFKNSSSSIPNAGMQAWTALCPSRYWYQSEAIILLMNYVGVRSNAESCRNRIP